VIEDILYHGIGLSLIVALIFLYFFGMGILYTYTFPVQQSIVLQEIGFSFVNDLLGTTDQSIPAPKNLFPLTSTQSIPTIYTVDGFTMMGEQISTAWRLKDNNSYDLPLARYFRDNSGNITTYADALHAASVLVYRVRTGQWEIWIPAMR
jgi:hypothetical protein